MIWWLLSYVAFHVFWVFCPSCYVIYHLFPLLFMLYPVSGYVNVYGIWRMLSMTGVKLEMSVCLRYFSFCTPGLTSPSLSGFHFLFFFSSIFVFYSLAVKLLSYHIVNIDLISYGTRDHAIHALSV